MGRPRWTGSTGGRQREGKKGASEGCRLCKAPFASTCRGHIVFCRRQALYCCPGEGEKNAQQRNSRSRSARASERAGLSCSHRQAVKRFFFFFSGRLFVFSFSIGMSTAQTRGTPATYVRRGVVARWWGWGSEDKRGVRRIIGLLAQHFSRWHFHSAGRTCSRLLW